MSSKFILALVGFLFVGLSINTCVSIHEEAKHPVSVVDGGDEGPIPVCTSTVSCELPPPKVVP